MTAGLPGVGIGGMFYLASALLMPLRSLGATLAGRGDDARWPLAVRQALLAAAVLGTVWATGWAIGWLVAAPAPAAALTHGGAAGGGEVHNVVRTAAIVGSLGTLALVLAGVQLLRICLAPRPTPRNAPAEPGSPARTAA